MEPIAVIGLACRFPGAPDADSFWELLRNGMDAVTEVPPERWDVEAVYHPVVGTTGKTNSRWGGFLERVDEFDAEFFGIGVREVRSMDPQQRLLLEVGWEALENAGVVPATLAGSRTGVFVGASTWDYNKILNRDFDILDAYVGPGTSMAIAANRLSYTFNLRGPSMVVDTACSSSLVAVHLACQSLRSLESNLVLVAGVNLILSEETLVTFSQAGMLAPDGRCKTFDERADGYVRSEGCGVLILKRHTDAVRDGDRILGLIRGSAVNQDGLSNGLTAPNGPAQQAVLREALANAGVAPAEIGYLETHGTGTRLGDPIEVSALKAVLMDGRLADGRCGLGSVKTNIGHAEAAAGMAGMIKVLLILRHGQIPPHLHLQKMSPLVAGLLAKTPFFIPTAPEPWPLMGRRLAGVSSFGFGGTNAHVILEEAIRGKDLRAEEAPEYPLQVLALSAKSKPALQALVGRYVRFLEAHPETAVADLCFSANTSRSDFLYRLAVVEEATAPLAQKLAAFSSSMVDAGVYLGERAQQPPKVAFLFTGQGAQYVDMGRELYRTEPLFRDTMNDCARLLRERFDLPLLEVLYPAESNGRSLLDRTLYAQPALFVLEYALAKLWRSWGIEPTAVLGHSLGEYVAACVAGAIDLESALGLVAERAKLLESLPPNGTMFQVQGVPEAVAAIVAAVGGELAVAAINTPSSVVISGERQAVAEVVARCEHQKMTCRPLNVSHAFHSPLVEPILDAFEAVAATVNYTQPRVTLLSNLDGQPIGCPTAAYWRQHLRGTIQFAAGMRTLYEQGYRVFVEIGPSSTLSSLGKRCLPEGCTLLPSLRRGQSDWQQLLQSLAALYAQGLKIDWQRGDPSAMRRRIVLPTYPFQRERHWFSSDLASRAPHRATVGHPLLGQRLLSPLKESLFTSALGQKASPFLRDHRVFDLAILPGAAYIEMALAACAILTKKAGPTCVEQLTLREALVLPEKSTKEIQLLATPEEGGSLSFQIHSRGEADLEGESTWTLHASGKVGAFEGSPPPPLQPEQLRFGAEEIDCGEYYAFCRQCGIKYGASFRALVGLWSSPSGTLGRIRLPEGLKDDPAFTLHPVLLDACFQAIGAGFYHQGRTDPFLPVRLEQLRLYSSPKGELWCHIRIHAPKKSRPQTLLVDLTLANAEGAIVAEVEGLLLKRAPQNKLHKDHSSDWLYRITWRPQPTTANAPIPLNPGRWLLLADRAGRAEQLAKHLAAQGQSSLLVWAGQSAESRPGVLSVDPEDPEQMARVVRAALAQEGTPCQGVVHLWSLDESTSGNPVAENLLAEQTRIGGGVLHLLQALGGGDSPPPRLWLVTRGAQPVSASPGNPELAAVWALGRTAALEHPELQCACVDLDPMPDSREDEQLAQELAVCDGESQVAYRRGVRHLARLERWSSVLPAEVQTTRLTLPSYGNLEELKYEATNRSSPGVGEVEVEVRATGLNFRDVLNALGLLEEYAAQFGITSASEVPFGFECAGTITAVGEGVSNLKVGDAVIAALAIGSMASYALVRAEFVVAKPKHLSFAEAATIPTAFLTAYHGLVELAGLRAGERVLIHAAAGGVGLAAVQIAQMLGAEVYATASHSKWEFLRSLGVKHLFNSRTLDFADEVLACTSGCGVDVVLNSLNGEWIERSLATTAPNGRFVEIGKLRIWDEKDVATHRPDIAYFQFDLGEIGNREPTQIARLLGKLMEHLCCGKLRPLPYTSFTADETVNAFRYMAQARHIGKVIVSRPPIAGADTIAVRPDGTYLVSGGLGALGLRVIVWLASQGACHLLLSRSSEPSPEACRVIKELEAKGVQVQVVQADVSRPDAVAALLAASHSMPPLRGILHAAGVLDDGMLLQQSQERFQRVLAAKALGAWHLHEQTQHFPLDFFVLFSSAAALLGSPGQGNYVVANALLDALAHRRQSCGLPALSINWGPWGGSGMAAGMKGSAAGITRLDPDQAVRLLAPLIATAEPQLGVLSLDWPKIATLPKIPSLLRNLVDASVKLTSTPVPIALNGKAIWLGAVSASEKREKVLVYLQEQTRRVLGITPSQLLDPGQPLSEMGLDSLIAVELRAWLQTELGLSLPMALLLEGKSLSLNQLADQVLGYVAGEQPVEQVTAEVQGDLSVWVHVPKPNPHARLRLFCFHYLAGGASAFRQWPEGLPQDIEVYALQLPGRENRRQEQPYECFPEVIESITQALLPYLDRPFAFYGHSMGALIAFELARCLHAEHGLCPVHLFAGAYFAPDTANPFQNQHRSDADVLKIMPHLLDASLSKRLHDVAFVEALLPLVRADLSLLDSYVYRESAPLPCPISVFGGKNDQLVSQEQLAQWRRHTAAEFTQLVLPGPHLFMVHNRLMLLEAVSQQLNVLCGSP